MERIPDADEWITQCEILTTRRKHRLAYRKRGAGPPILLLHGFPTWSYDYAAVAADLERDHEVITLDFLGYGASEKPNPYDYSVAESADCVEDLVSLLKVSTVNLVVHDYGGIVGQELVDRQLSAKLPFSIVTLTILNCGIVYSAYRPTAVQRLLILPIIGKLIASRITAQMVRNLMEGIWGTKKLSDEEFNELWKGVSLENGHKLAHLHIKYNKERELHHRRWEEAIFNWQGPLQLIWGLADPVSGKHVLNLAVKTLPRAKVVELDGVGHYPQVEAPEKVAQAIRESLGTIQASP
jgi:pimeloyl-ACP methyl ester carboxylesterase